MHDQAPPFGLRAPERPSRAGHGAPGSAPQSRGQELRSHLSGGAPRCCWRDDLRRDADRRATPHLPSGERERAAVRRIDGGHRCLLRGSETRRCSRSGTTCRRFRRSRFSASSRCSRRGFDAPKETLPGCPSLLSARGSWWSLESQPAATGSLRSSAGPTDSTHRSRDCCSTRAT